MTDSQHRFMNACYYILIACGWDDDEAYIESKEALDEWEYSNLYTCIECGSGYSSNSDMAFINFTDENHVCHKCHKATKGQAKS